MNKLNKENLKKSLSSSSVSRSLDDIKGYLLAPFYSKKIVQIQLSKFCFWKLLIFKCKKQKFFNYSNGEDKLEDGQKFNLSDGHKIQIKLQKSLDKVSDFANHNKKDDLILSGGKVQLINEAPNVKYWLYKLNTMSIS